MSMEEALIVEESKEKKWNNKEVTWKHEFKEVGYLAAPLVAVSVLQYLLRLISVTMAGHVGHLSLPSVSIANSFTTVTGFSLIYGLTGGLETLCGQAYGAEQYRKLGIYTYCSIISLTLVCFPISLVWMFEDKLLVLMGQDPSVSEEAGKYSVLLLPALFADAIQKSCVRFLQTQGLTLGMLVTSFLALCFHVPVCWALVYKFEMGTSGAALSLGLSYWLCVAMLVLYIKYSSVCEKTRSSFTVEVFLSIREYFRFAFPSAIMACLEWWSFELIVLLSGTLPNGKLESSVLSICLATTALHYLMSYGISCATSTRVSNELGAGNPVAAKRAMCVGIILTAAEAVAVAVILFCCRSFLGYAFSNEKEVVEYVAEITPLLCISVIMDGLQAVLSGIARGSGWQHKGAYVNLGAYYLVGIPISLVLCYRFHMRGTRLWIGLIVGSTVQVVLLALVTIFTNWQKQGIEARERILNKINGGDNCSSVNEK